MEEKLENEWLREKVILICEKMDFSVLLLSSSLFKVSLGHGNRMFSS